MTRHTLTLGDPDGVHATDIEIGDEGDAEVSTGDDVIWIRPENFAALAAWFAARAAGNGDPSAWRDIKASLDGAAPFDELARMRAENERLRAAVESQIGRLERAYTASVYTVSEGRPVTDERDALAEAIRSGQVVAHAEAGEYDAAPAPSGSAIRNAALEKAAEAVYAALYPKSKPMFWSDVDSGAAGVARRAKELILALRSSPVPPTVREEELEKAMRDAPTQAGLFSTHRARDQRPPRCGRRAAD